ncbi:triose-phosphate isomerase [Leptospira wolffii]|uniref:Triosephosphate isomerase n=1 Tax=Leptospira wolffii TaxID=409998 RepID=A0A2M9ZD42_9LEPT|nr:triose-phosphate isomerase [Leptospira wolffii]PJZ66272.1 triose-phosphate isomerase [Leptospira wolffii]TGK60173.1 triose-phosphate isomerase [Leptospira wolffii]TGK72515.1 triose-phosphate isomerase [Leptospira wolffii]TGK76180.1 triose-phosphate isomerase [Leptospira wolffii]TGL30432.1 triose-phosphate isomerase [Leptospira wolffii]
MRPKIIAGNWKMNLSEKEALQLAQGLKEKLPSKLGSKKAVVFPSAIHLASVARILEGSGVQVGAQNVYPAPLTAMTGENGPDQLAELGLGFALVGHSERRQFLGETNEFCNRKIAYLVQRNFTAVYCVGETLEERESGKTFEVLGRQIRDGLASISSDQFPRIWVAYEPVWAIGTGKVATPAQAQEAHAFIRKEIAGLFQGGKAVADVLPILYGGSVKADNVKELLSQADIDGGLVGGASQKLDSFLALF